MDNNTFFKKMSFMGYLLIIGEKAGFLSLHFLNKKEEVTFSLFATTL